MLSRTLWVSPMNSPVRLGVSPAATSTPTGVFNQRFEALFPCTETQGPSVCLTPQLFLPVYMHLFRNVHPLWVLQPLPCPPAAALLQVLSAQLPYPPLLPVWMNVSSLTPWLLDFHTVQFSVSSGGFLVLNLFLSFWLCKKAQCVYLSLHLGQKSESCFFLRTLISAQLGSRIKRV